MANEFVIKNGFISNGDSIVSGSLSAQTLNINSLTSSIDDTKVLTIDDNGVVHTVPISGLTENTFITGFTYNDSNTFILSDNSGRTFTANINTLTGLTINGNLIVTGTTNLNLVSATALTVNYIDFNLTANPVHQEGRIHWNDNTKTLEVDTENNQVHIEVGHENIVRVVNNTGTQLLKGQLVYINGAQGGRPTVTLASYENDNTSARTLGFIAANINDGNNGYVITYGILRDVNTLAYTAGTPIFLFTGGTYTNVRPIAPKHEVRLGYILNQNATTGSIFVNVMNGYELTELHDVSATTVNNLDVLQWSSSDNVWKPTSNPTFNSISATTYYNLPFYDAGILSNYNGWSNNGNGSMNLPQVQVGLYDNPNYTPPLRTYTVSSGVTGSNGISGLTNNDTNYIYIEYNGGNPRWVVSTDNSAINGSDVVRFQNVYRIGNFIHNLEWGNEGTGLPNKIANRIDSVNRFARESGLSLGLSGSTGIVTLSSGVAWNGTLRQSLDPVNSQTDIFFQNFHSGGTWVISTTADTLNNLYYDNGTDRVEANTGTYLVNWYFRGQEINDHLYEVLGNTGYTSVSEARLSTEPSLPELITSHAFLLGRIIVQKGSLNGIVETAFTQIFQPTTVQEHNDLTGLQGGTSGEYYHLTSNQVNNLALTNTSNNFTSQQTFSGGLNSTVLSGGTLYGDGSNLTNIVTSITTGSGLSGNSTNGNITLVNTAPNQTVTLTGGTNIQITGGYPNFGINFTGTTGVSGDYLPLSGGTVTGSTTFTNGLISNSISATTITGDTFYGDGINLQNVITGATNLGNGIGLYNSISNKNLQFNSITGDSLNKITTTLNGNNVEIGINEQNLSIYPLVIQGNRLISGGVSYVSGLTFNISPLQYIINGEIYNTTSISTVTLSSGDTNFDRIDIIGVNISGDTFVVNGQPSANPQKPNIDQSVELELTFVIVGVNAIVPNITNNVIYSEFLGQPTEWNFNTNDSIRIDGNSTIDSYIGTKSIRVTGVTGNYVTNFTLSSNTNYDTSQFTNLQFAIKNRISNASNTTIRLRFLNSLGAQNGNVVLLPTDVLYNNTNITSWQLITIPLWRFNLTSEFVRTLEISFRTSGSNTANYFFDYFEFLQGFYTAPPVNSWVTIRGDGITSITAPSPSSTLTISGGTNIGSVVNTSSNAVVLNLDNEISLNSVTSNIISATTISGGTFYGDGRNLQGVPKYYAEPSTLPTTPPIASNDGIAIGNGAVATGSTILALGFSAGQNSSDSSSSNFIGFNAGDSSTFVSNSNFIGNQAGFQSVSGRSSNFIGYTAGQQSFNCNGSNIIGLNAGNSSSNGIESNFIGPGAGQLSSNGRSSNFIGLFAGYNTQNASYSNLFGYNVGKKVGSNDIGSNNIIIGTNITLPNATENAINLGNVLYGINTYNTLTGSANSTPTSNGKIGIGIITPLNRLHVTDNTDPLRLGGLQTLNTDTEVLTTDTNGVIHKRTYDFVTGLTYNDQNRITVNTTVGSYGATINQMTGLTINGDLTVTGNYIVSGDTVISGATLFSGTTTMQSVSNAIGDFLTLPTNNLVSRRTSDQVRDDIGYYGLTFAITNGYF